MSKYTDFYPARSSAGFPYTGSATITGSLATTGSGNFASSVPASLTGTWTAGGNMNQSRGELNGVGTQAAAAAFAGNVGSNNNTENYNGSTWSTSGTISTPRYLASAAGTQTAGLMASGWQPGSSNATEEYNGSTWSAGGNVIIARQQAHGDGTQTAAVMAGGGTPVIQNASEEYNGTSWSAGGNMIIGRFLTNQAVGTQTALIAVGGFTPTITNVSENYNGTSWSSGPNMIGNRVYGAMSGTQNEAFVFAGQDPAITGTGEFLASNAWTAASGNMIISRRLLGGDGDTATGAIAFGGITPANSAATEEWSGTSTAGDFTTNFNFDAASGDTTVLALVQTSAARYKNNIESLGAQMPKINALRPVRYSWKDRNAQEEIGFIAEEVQQIYPELVSKDEAGKVSGINYAKMVSVLVKSVQEQQDKIEGLNRELDDLTK